MKLQRDEVVLKAGEDGGLDDHKLELEKDGGEVWKDSRWMHWSDRAKGLILLFGRQVNAPTLTSPILLSLGLLSKSSVREVRLSANFLYNRLRGAWPAHFFIFHLSCTVSPGNNGALHYITRPLCIHAIQSDIQSGSNTPPNLAIIGRTIPSKSQVGHKKREVLYLRWRLTSICDTINQFGPSLSLSVSRHCRHSLNKERRLFEWAGAHRDMAQVK